MPWSSNASDSKVAHLALGGTIRKAHLPNQLAAPSEAWQCAEHKVGNQRDHKGDVDVCSNTTKEWSCHRYPIISACSIILLLSTTIPIGILVVEVTEQSKWSKGWCVLADFDGDGPDRCNGDVCTFKVGIAEDDGGPPARASSRYDHEARHWLPPRRRGDDGSSLIWTGEAFRCCNPTGQSKCCDLRSRRSMCDNWGDQQDAEGRQCPHGWWACDYKLQERPHQSTKTTTVSPSLAGRIVTTFRNATELRLHEPVPYASTLGCVSGIVFLAIFVAASPSLIRRFKARREQNVPRPKNSVQIERIRPHLSGGPVPLYDRVLFRVSASFEACAYALRRVFKRQAGDDFVLTFDPEIPTAVPSDGTDDDLQGKSTDVSETPDVSELSEELSVASKQTRPSLQPSLADERRISRTSAASGKISAASAGRQTTQPRVFVNSSDLHIFVKDAPRLEPIIEPLARSCAAPPRPQSHGLQPLKVVRAPVEGKPMRSRPANEAKQHVARKGKTPSNARCGEASVTKTYTAS